MCPQGRSSHCVKSVQIRSFSWSEYTKIRPRKNSVFGLFTRRDYHFADDNNFIFPSKKLETTKCTITLRKKVSVFGVVLVDQITNQNNSEYGHFSRSVINELKHTHRERLVFYSIQCRNGWLAASDLFDTQLSSVHSIISTDAWKKNVIHQIDSKNGWLLLSASFTAKFGLVFVLTLENAFS